MKTLVGVVLALGLMLSTASAEAKRAHRVRHLKRHKAVASQKAVHKAKLDAQRAELARAESQLSEVRGGVATASAAHAVQQAEDNEIPR